MHCPQCGCETVESASFCHACGVSVSEMEDVRIATTDPLLDTVERSPASAKDTLETPRDRMSRAASRDENEEKDLWEGGYSPRALIPVTVGVGLVTLLALIGCIALGASASGWGIVAAAIVVGWFALMLRFAYLRLSVHYFLSSQRLIHEHGMFRRVTHRIDVITIDDVTFEQSFIQRFLGVGRIRVASGERQTPELVMMGIDKVDDVADLIDSTRRRERERRGLHIETV